MQCKNAKPRSSWNDVQSDYSVSSALVQASATKAKQIPSNDEQRDTPNASKNKSNTESFADIKKGDDPAKKLPTNESNLYGASVPGFEEIEEHMDGSRGPASETGSNTFARNQNLECDDTIVSEMTNPTIFHDKSSVASPEEADGDVLQASFGNVDAQTSNRQMQLDPPKFSSVPDPFDTSFDTSAFFSSRDPFAAPESQSNAISMSENVSFNANFFSSFQSDSFVMPKSQQSECKPTAVAHEFDHIGDPPLEVVEMASSDEEDEVDDLAKTIVNEFQNESQSVPSSIATNQDKARGPVTSTRMQSDNGNGDLLTGPGSSLSSPSLLRKKRNELKRRRAKQTREYPVVNKPSDESSDATLAHLPSSASSASFSTAEETHLDPPPTESDSITSEMKSPPNHVEISSDGRSKDQNVHSAVPASVASRHDSFLSPPPITRLTRSPFARKQGRNRISEQPRKSDTLTLEETTQSKGKVKKNDPSVLEDQKPPSDDTVTNSVSSQQELFLSQRPLVRSNSSERARSFATKQSQNRVGEQPRKSDSVLLEKPSQSTDGEKPSQSTDREKLANEIVVEDQKPTSVAELTTISGTTKSQPKFTRGTARARSLARNSSATLPLEIPSQSKKGEESADDLLPEEQMLHAPIIASSRASRSQSVGTGTTRALAKNRASRSNDDVSKTNEEPRSILKKPRRALPTEPSKFVVSRLYT